METKERQIELLELVLNHVYNEIAETEIGGNTHNLEIKQDLSEDIEYMIKCIKEDKLTEYGYVEEILELGKALERENGVKM